MKIYLKSKALPYIKMFLDCNGLKAEESSEGDFLVLNEPLAIDLQDLAMDKLQEVGFDVDYSLTEEGLALQDLIDKIDDKLLE